MQGCFFLNLSKKIVFFFFFFWWIWIIDSSDNIVKISEKKNKQAKLIENLPPNYLPYRFLHTVDSRYLEFQELSERYPHLDISDFQNWGIK